eukprot:14262052-Alexandrium_andersonii.AAC.1
MSLGAGALARWVPSRGLPSRRGLVAPALARAACALPALCHRLALPAGRADAAFWHYQGRHRARALSR